MRKPEYGAGVGRARSLSDLEATQPLQLLEPAHVLALYPILRPAQLGVYVIVDLRRAPSFCNFGAVHYELTNYSTRLGVQSSRITSVRW